MTTTQKIITALNAHGFEGFINADKETVSFYVSVTGHGQSFEELVTVNSTIEALIAIGY